MLLIHLLIQKTISELFQPFECLVSLRHWHFGPICIWSLSKFGVIKLTREIGISFGVTVNESVAVCCSCWFIRLTSKTHACYLSPFQDSLTVCCRNKISVCHMKCGMMCHIVTSRFLLTSRSFIFCGCIYSILLPEVNSSFVFGSYKTSWSHNCINHKYLWECNTFLK